MATKPPTGKAPTLADLKADPANRRRRTDRSARLLRESLSTVGPARSVVIDEHDQLLAGSGTLQAAIDVGLTKVQIVETDGETLVAVRRRGLTEAQKLALALYDNRTAELSEWDPEPLAEDAATGALTPFFNPAEVRAIVKAAHVSTAAPAIVKEVDTATVQDRFWIAVEGPLAAQAEALRRLREVMETIPGITVELGTIPSETWEPTP